MNSSYLKLNDEKIEFVLLGSRQQLAEVNVAHINIGDARIACTSRFGKGVWGDL